MAPPHTNNKRQVSGTPWLSLYSQLGEAFSYWRCRCRIQVSLASSVFLSVQIDNLHEDQCQSSNDVATFGNQTPLFLKLFFSEQHQVKQNKMGFLPAKPSKDSQLHERPKGVWGYSTRLKEKLPVGLKWFHKFSSHTSKHLKTISCDYYCGHSPLPSPLWHGVGFSHPGSIKGWKW